MIEDKILQYKNSLVLAQKMVRNQYADRDYYEEMISRLERMLRFYENLKMWKEISES
ncbi:unnamed protein product [marine sediment metagenome]|uniref:Uncharacterized protein n=1 Tax=marine sediment metagenome TaxID=412755 RepID=X1S2B3_9ZZZZ